MVRLSRMRACAGGMSSCAPSPPTALLGARLLCARKPCTSRTTAFAIWTASERTTRSATKQTLESARASPRRDQVTKRSRLEGPSTVHLPLRRLFPRLRVGPTARIASTSASTSASANTIFEWIEVLTKPETVQRNGTGPVHVERYPLVSAHRDRRREQGVNLAATNTLSPRSRSR